MGALGAHHPEVKELRRLLRDASARRAAGCCVLEGPRVLAGAFERGARIDALYVGADARLDARAVAERVAAEAAIEVQVLAAGVAARVADVRTTSGVLATAVVARPPMAALDGGDWWVVAAHVSDPGNLGTIVRAAEAAGARGIAIGHGSADPYNPKVVRASAGAIFGIPMVEGDAVVILEQLAARGVRRVGAAAHGGMLLHDPSLDAVLCAPVAVVVGHETHGLGDLPVDELVTIPMAGAAESLNVAMASTVVLFEIGRRRALPGTSAR